MNYRDEVGPDDRANILELHKQGHGRNTIASYTGINASAVKSVIDGSRITYADKLSHRQITGLLMRGFRPIRSEK